VFYALCLDGGGVRGLYSAKLLFRLVKAHPTLLNKVDLIAGASIGGVVALALAFGTSIDDVVSLLETQLPAMFEDSWYDDIKDFGNMLGADYSTTNIQKTLVNHFGKTTLGQLNKKVLIPAIDLDNEASDPARRTWKPKFFNNYQQSDQSVLVSDVGVRATAAPTYFPTYQGYIDGGVVINNPSVAALCQAIDSGTGNQDISKITLLSIGTGYHPTYISGDNLDWGITQWAKPLVSMIIDNTVDISHYQCSKLLKDKYRRVNGDFPSPIALDSTKKLDDLIAQADALDLTAHIQWLQTNWV